MQSVMHELKYTSKQRMLMLCIGLLLSACSSGPFVKAAADDEVRRLCAIDGGIKVYETVTLPPNKFNQHGQVNFYKPLQNENALGSEYKFEMARKAYIAGVPTINPSHLALERVEIKVTRRADNKMLGMAIGYVRAGGDFPGPSMPSSFSCPDVSLVNEITLFSKIFVKGVPNE